VVPWTQTGVEDEDEEDEKEGDDGDALLAEEAREVTQAADLKRGEHGAHRGLRVVLLMEDNHLEVAEGAASLGLTWEGEGDPETDEEPDLDLRVGLHELRLVLAPVLVADLKQRLFHSRLSGLLWCDLSGYNMPIIVIGAPLEA
jgi:hypothetical protein